MWKATTDEAKRDVIDRIRSGIAEGAIDFGTLTPNDLNALLGPFVSSLGEGINFVTLTQQMDLAAMAVENFRKFVDADDIVGLQL